MVDGWTVVVLGGYDKNEMALNSVQFIDIVNGTIIGVDNAPDLPYEMTTTSVVTDESGQNVFVVASRYPRASDRLVWALSSDFKHKRWNQTPKPSIRREVPITFILNNILYITGGPGYMECIDLKNMSSGWRNCGSKFPQGIFWASSCIMDDWVWFSGGYHVADYSGISAGLYHWKPDYGWQRKKDMLIGCVYHAMTSDGKRVYVIGGLEFCQSVEAFDVKDNRWHVLSKLPVPLFHIGAVYLPWGQIVVPGGRDLDPLIASNDIYVYNIKEDSWVISTVNLTRQFILLALL